MKMNPEESSSTVWKNIKDQRKKVTTVTKKPYHSIGLLSFKREGIRAWTTASLIWPNVVITSANELWQRKKKQEVTEVKFIPNQNGMKKPYGAIQATMTYIPPEYKRGDKSKDFALIFLEQQVKPELTHFSLLSLSPLELKEKEVNVTGYPVEKVNGIMGYTIWNQSGSAQTNDETFIQHDCYTSPGQNGSVIWCQVKGVYFAIGLHIAGGIQPSGIYFTGQVIDRIIKQINDYQKNMNLPLMEVAETRKKEIKEIVKKPEEKKIAEVLDYQFAQLQVNAKQDTSYKTKLVEEVKEMYQLEVVETGNGFRTKDYGPEPETESTVTEKASKKGNSEGDVAFIEGEYIDEVYDDGGVTVFDEESNPYGEINMGYQIRFMGWPNKAFGLISGKWTYKDEKGVVNTVPIVASGVLISKAVVLTAAHCIYSRKYKKEGSSFKFFPAMDGITIPYGEAEIDEVRYPKEFKEDFGSMNPYGYHKYDYALCFLKKPIGSKTGYVSLEFERKDYENVQLKMTGYSSEIAVDVDARYQWETDVHQLKLKEDDINIKGVTDKIYYKTRTRKGNSGAGIWHEENGKVRLAGIHCRKLARSDHPKFSYNQGHVFSKENFQRMENWMQEMIKIRIKEILQSNTMRQYDLSNQEIKDFGVKYLCSFSLPYLQKINVQGNCITSQGCFSFQNTDWKELLELDLSKNKVDSKGVEYICKSNFEKMEVVNFAKNNIGAEGVQVLSSSNKWKGLLSIDLSQNDIGANGAKFLGGTRWSKLEHLMLEKANIGDAGAGFLSKCIWPHLKTLKLDENKISSPGMKQLAINGHWKNLEVLQLNKNILEAPSLENFNYCCWQKLKKLELKDNSKLLLTFLKLPHERFWSELEQLYLDGCFIEASGIKNIQRFKFSNLKTLEMSNTNMKNDAFSELVECNMPQMEFLDVSQNKLNAASLSALKAGLWPNLKSIMFHGNDNMNNGFEKLHIPQWENIIRISLPKGTTDLGITLIVATKLPFLVLLSPMGQITRMGAQIIAKVYSIILIQLNLSVNPLGDIGVKSLMSRPFLLLKVLELTCIGMTDQGVTHLVEGKMQNLENLIISHNSITKQGARTLSRANWNKLQKLDMSNNQISENDYEELKLLKRQWPRALLLWR